MMKVYLFFSAMTKEKKILKNFNFPFILNKKYDIISNENSNKSKDIKNINYC